MNYLNVYYCENCENEREEVMDKVCNDRCPVCRGECLPEIFCRVRTSQETLVEFMKEKRRLCDSPQYFNVEDEKELLALRDDEASLILSTISEYLNKRIRSKGATSIEKILSIFNALSCPFCYIQYKRYHNCEGCGYGQRHGICDDSECDYRASLDILLSLLKKQTYLDISKICDLLSIPQLDTEHSSE